MLAVSDGENVREIGTAIHNVSIPGAAYGKGPNGEEWIYAVSTGSPAIFNVIDAKTGERVDSFPLEGASSSWGVTVDPDGNVYIGTYRSSLLFRYVPGADHVELIGKPIKGESYIWRLASDDQGRIYGGTYPGGKVFQYDPKTDTFRDYGQMVEGQQYARSLDVYKDKVYVGVGTKGPNLVELDIETGEKREIPLPEKYADSANVYGVNVAKDKLFAWVTGVNTVLVYDLETMDLVDEIEHVDGLDVSSAGPKNEVYMIINKELHAYHLKKKSLRATGFDNLMTARDFGWVKLKQKGFPGKTLVSITFDGSIRMYNPQSGKYQTIQGQVEGEPATIQSLAQGPDGNIYVGGYFSGGLSTYDYKADAITEYKGIAQIEGMTTFRDKLYMGVYTGAQLHSYDPQQPYNYGVNPVEHFRLRDEGQDRPFALAPAGEQLAMGTVPDYGKLGGTLSFFNPATEEYFVHHDVVKEQSITALAYKNGLVYGGTSVYGGLGTTPSQEEGKLFVWDVAKGKKVSEVVPIPGEKAITALTFDNDGKLWGITAGYLFQYDPEAGKVVRYEQLYPFKWEQVEHYWRGGFLAFDEDGYLYGSALNHLFKVDPKTWESETLVDNAALFAQDAAGNIYFSRGHKLYQYKK
ncbi:ligand-binding sensor domain-containing protein [Numidum massiliense]|uniref:hypothetical protein n=1 Tax=Numidum massiliense TaxID=1522315 RepID=UPI0006D54E41|nr:hypothetical protein [Numidum massiliense]